MKNEINEEMQSDEQFWERRPLTLAMINYAA